jgi:hypothetical protein
LQQKKCPRQKIIADTSPKTRFRQLPRRLCRLFSLLDLRRFSFSEPLSNEVDADPHSPARGEAPRLQTITGHPLTG